MMIAVLSVHLFHASLGLKLVELLDVLLLGLLSGHTSLGYLLPLAALVLSLLQT